MPLCGDRSAHDEDHNGVRAAGRHGRRSARRRLPSIAPLRYCRSERQIAPRSGKFGARRGIDARWSGKFAAARGQFACPDEKNAPRKGIDGAPSSGDAARSGKFPARKGNLPLGAPFIPLGGAFLPGGRAAPELNRRIAALPARSPGGWIPAAGIQRGRGVLSWARRRPPSAGRPAAAPWPWDVPGSASPGRPRSCLRPGRSPWRRP